jgi:hypothetical protein
VVAACPQPDQFVLGDGETKRVAVSHRRWLDWSWAGGPSFLIWLPFVSRGLGKVCSRVVVGGSGMWLVRRADVRGQVGHAGLQSRPRVPTRARCFAALHPHLMITERKPLLGSGMSRGHRKVASLRASSSSSVSANRSAPAFCPAWVAFLAPTIGSTPSC